MNFKMKKWSLISRGRITPIIVFLISLILVTSSITVVGISSEDKETPTNVRERPRDDKDIFDTTNEEINSVKNGENGLNSVVVQPGPAMGKDTYITNFSSNDGRNYGTDAEMNVGSYNGDQFRSLVQFDLPDENVEIKSATLSLYEVTNIGLNTHISVRPLVYHWDEGLSAGLTATNWTHRTDTTTWVSPGGDYSTLKESNRHCGLSDVWFTWNVTKIVQNWVDSSWENHGFLLMPHEYTLASEFMRFYTSDHSDPNLRPKLTLTYENIGIPDQEYMVNSGAKNIDLKGKGLKTVENEPLEPTSNNVIPFWGSSYDEMRCQFIYDSKHIGAEGTMSRLSFNRNDFDVGNYSNLRISMAHTNLENLTTTFDNNYMGSLTEVFYSKNIELNSSNGNSWIHFDLNQSFVYDSSYNLVVDITWYGDGGSSVSLYAKNDISGEKRVYAYDKDASTGSTDPTFLIAKFDIEIENSDLTWVAQSMDPDLFKASLSGTNLVITPKINSMGEGTLHLTSMDNHYNKYTQKVKVSFDMKDTYITDAPGHEYENFGGAWSTSVGTYDADSEIRALMEFELPPKKGIITSASISMYCLGFYSPGGKVNISASPLTSSWNENDGTGEEQPVNWYVRTSTNDWNDPGGDYDPSYISYQTVSKDYCWYDWNITDIVRAWYNGDLNNNGLIMKGINYGPSPFNYIYFGAAQQDSSPEEYWPKININFKKDISDQHLQEDDPTKSVPLGSDYSDRTHISGPLNTTNPWPFYATYADEVRCQFLYTPNQVGAEGVIKRIALNRSTNAVGNFSDLKIYMAHTELYDLTTTFSDNYQGYKIEVYSVDEYETNSSNNDPWINFNLNRNFTYDSSHNLLIEMVWQGDGNTNVRTQYSDIYTGRRRLINWDLSSTTGTGDYLLPVMRFETEIMDNAVIDEGKSSNYWPFAPESEPFLNYQMLYKSSSIKGNGNIDKISFQSYPTTPQWAVVENLTIKIAHSTNDSLDENLHLHNSSPWVEVLTSPYYNVSTKGDVGWIEFDIEDTFDYNGNDNLLIDIRWEGGRSSVAGILLNIDYSVPYNGRAWSIDSGNGSSSGLYNINIDFKDAPNWRIYSDYSDLFTTSVPGNTLEITPKQDASGTGHFYLIMKDCNYVNISQQEVKVTIDPVNDAPELSGPSTLQCTEDVDKTINMTSYASDVDHSVSELTYSADTTYATVDGSEITFNYPNGITSETVEITVEDPDGATGSVSVDVSITAVNDPPVLSDIGEINCTEDTDYVLNMTNHVIDQDNTYSELTFMTNSSYVSVDGIEIIFNYPEGITSEIVEIYVEDLDGANDTITVQVNIEVVNDAPEIIGPSEIDCTEELDFVLNLTSNITDPDNSLSEITLSTNSSYTSVDGFIVTFNYPEGVLEETVRITVEDSQGSSSSITIEVTVVPVNDPPVISGAPTTLEVNEDEVYLLDMSLYTSDPDDDIADLTFSTDSTYTTIEDHEIVFLYEDITEETVIITVEDSGGLTDSVQIDITINPSLETPEIVSHYPIGTDIELDTELIIEFSIPMSEIETEDAFTLIMASTEVDVTYSWNTDHTKLTIVPNSELAEGDYTAEISTDATSSEGINIAEEYSWSFTVVEPSEDSDGDGMDDDWEEDNGLDPTIDDSEDDPDNDGIPNGIEYEYDLDPQTDDSGDDLDGDEIPNEIEYEHGLILDADDSLGDIDNDGMPNGWEYEFDFDLSTDDAEDDFDGDEYTNLEEYQEGTDPTDVNDYPKDVSVDDDADEGEGIPIWIVGIIVIIVLAVAIAGFMMLRKRKHQPTPSEYNEETPNEPEEEPFEENFEEEFEEEDIE